MRNFKVTCLAASALLWGLSSCSSTNTDTTTTNTTAEEVTTDRTTARPQSEVVGNVTPPPGNGSTATPLDTTSFYVLAASSDITEIQAGVQAKARAMHPEVKKFAEQMITDHTKSSDELKNIAGAHYIIPNTPVPAHQRMLNKLAREEDADEFDEEYMKMQVIMHGEAVKLFESASKSQSDPALKAFAAKMLPTLRMHLDMAKKTKDMVK